jgi:hypothetical protein
LLITFIELIKNPRYNFWTHNFCRCAAEVRLLPAPSKLWPLMQLAVAAQASVATRLPVGFKAQLGWWPPAHPQIAMQCHAMQIEKLFGSVARSCLGPTMPQGATVGGTVTKTDEGISGLA